MSRAVDRENHRVPEHARAETARTLAATPGIRGEPSDAERGRTLLAAARTGALATVALDPPGSRSARSSPTPSTISGARCCACPTSPSTAATSPPTHGRR